MTVLPPEGLQYTSCWRNFRSEINTGFTQNLRNDWAEYPQLTPPLLDPYVHALVSHPIYSWFYPRPVSEIYYWYAVLLHTFRLHSVHFVLGGRRYSFNSTLLVIPWHCEAPTTPTGDARRVISCHTIPKTAVKAIPYGYMYYIPCIATHGLTY